MYEILRPIHSVNRWIVLVLLLVAIIGAISKWSSNKPYTESDRKTALLTLIFTHIQFLIGLTLLFVSKRNLFEGEWIKDPVRRFFGMEHMAMMILGVIIITAGYSIAKRKSESKSKFKFIAIFYGIGLLVILSRIPWPGMHGTSWY